ncbi:GIY-YIG nuclease family protein [Burkholderia sp. 3C]
MSTQSTYPHKKHGHREDDPCPLCHGGRIKLRERHADGVVFLGCSNFMSGCKFNHAVPEKPGYVYVLANSGFHLNGVPVVKIGYTTHTLKASLEQLYKTGVPFEFRIEYQAMVWKAWATMRRAHLALHDRRLNPDRIERDFFACSIEEAVNALHTAVQGDIAYKAVRPPEPRGADDDIDPATHREPDAEAARAAREAWLGQQRTRTPGYVYVMANRVYHDGRVPLLKIGYTGLNPEARAGSLYYYEREKIDYRGVPQRFDVVHAAHFSLAFDAEQGVHRALDPWRVNPNREFFRCTVDEAVTAIQAELNREALAVAQRDAAEQARKEWEAVEQARKTREAVEQMRKAQEVANQQAQERAARAVVQPAPAPAARRSSKPRPRRSLLSRLFITGCVLAAAYAVDLVSDRLKPHPPPAVQKPANDRNAKKAHAHGTKRRPHRSPKPHQVEPGAAETEPQNDLPYPVDLDPPGR